MVGVLVALAARGGFQISAAERADPVALAWVSFAATLLWAFLDAFFALLAAKGSRLRWAHLTDDQRDPAERGHAWAHEALNHTFLANLEEEALARIREQAVKEAEHARPVSPRLTADDWLAALAVFVVVLAAGLPPIAPILVIADPQAAAWASYGMALVLMFALGMHWGPAHGLHRLRSGLSMLAVGAVLVAIVLLLGG